MLMVKLGIEEKEVKFRESRLRSMDKVNSFKSTSLTFGVKLLLLTLIFALFLPRTASLQQEGSFASLNLTYPTVFDNIANSLVARTELLVDFDLLDAKFGSLLINITNTASGESMPPFPRVSMKFSDFLAGLRTEERRKEYYFQQVEIDKFVPGLIEMCGIDRAAPHYLWSEISLMNCDLPTMFIGSQGIRTSLHFDRFPHRHPLPSGGNPGVHNFFLQISGRRRVILIPPEFRDDLRPDFGKPWDHVSTTKTFIHQIPRHTSMEDQIEFLKASGVGFLESAWRNHLEYELLPNQAILIPAKWWHCTELLEQSVALNWWFKTDDLRAEYYKLLSELFGTKTSIDAEDVNNAFGPEDQDTEDAEYSDDDDSSLIRSTLHSEEFHNLRKRFNSMETVTYGPPPAFILNNEGRFEETFEIKFNSNHVEQIALPEDKDSSKPTCLPTYGPSAMFRKHSELDEPTCSPTSAPSG